MKRDFMFTSESVTEGHPDKLCDQISDAIIDRFLQQDPFSRVIAECAVSTGILFIASRFASHASIDIPETARQVINQVGYERKDFNAKDCTIMTSFTELPGNQHQTRDETALDDEEIEEITAKNVANAFGFACIHTPAMLPLPVWLAHKLARRLASVRLQRQLSYLAPDGKTQVGVEFKDRKPYRIHSITLIASQYGPHPVNIQRLRRDLCEQVIEPVFLDEELKPDEKRWSSSIPRDCLSLAAPRCTLVLPAARPPSIPMVNTPETARRRFQARTLPESIGWARMRPVMPQKM